MQLDIEDMKKAILQKHGATAIVGSLYVTKVTTSCLLRMPNGELETSENIFSVEGSHIPDPTKPIQLV